MSRGYVPSAWDLPWQERAEINAMYAEMEREMEQDKPSMVEMVREFHEKFGVVVDPKFQNVSNVVFRCDLIDEERRELDEALFDETGELREDLNKREVADALVDILYATLGAAESWGIDIERVFAEIHRSNMTHLGI